MKDETHIAPKKPLQPRKRVLVPKAILKADQPLTANLAGLNSNFFRGSAASKGGAPFGNKNALRHGHHTREMRAFRAEVRAHVRDSWNLVAAVKRLLREATGDNPAAVSDPPDSQIYKAPCPR